MLNLLKTTSLQILQGYPIHVFCVPPTGVRLMQAETGFTALKNSRLKRCLSGGEPVVNSVSRCQCFACSLLIMDAKIIGCLLFFAFLLHGI